AAETLRVAPSSLAWRCGGSDKQGCLSLRSTFPLVPKLLFGNACLRNSVSRMPCRPMPRPSADGPGYGPRNGGSRRCVPKQEFGNEGAARLLGATIHLRLLLGHDAHLPVTEAGLGARLECLPHVAVAGLFVGPQHDHDFDRAGGAFFPGHALDAC